MTLPPVEQVVHETTITGPHGFGQTWSWSCLCGAPPWPPQYARRANAERDAVEHERRAS